MRHADSPTAPPLGSLPWPTAWARRTRGPQYRPAIVGGVVCFVLSGAIALENVADGLVLGVFALGMFIWAVRPATRYPIRVTLAPVPGRGPDYGAQFPLRITNPLAALRRRPTVTLVPAGVVVDRGVPLTIPWTQITEVRATEAQTGMPHPLLPAPRRNWLTIAVADPAAVRRTRSTFARRFGGNTVTGFPTTDVLSDPVVLFHTLHFYLDNPHARHELAREDAITRIRTARVDPEDC